MKWFQSKTVDDVFDKDSGLLAKAGAWIGNSNLTTEEIMESNSATVISVQNFVKATLSESTARSVTRRSVAVNWIKVHLGFYLMSAVAAPWDGELADFYLKLANSNLLFVGTSAIIIFFFGSHGLTKYQEAKSNKK